MKNKSNSPCSSVPESICESQRLTTEVLLLAEIILAGVTQEMQAEYKASEGKWPRDWMQKHVNEQAHLINARKVLCDRAEHSANDESSNPTKEG